MVKIKLSVLIITFLNVNVVYVYERIFRISGSYMGFNSESFFFFFFYNIDTWQRQNEAMKTEGEREKKKKKNTSISNKVNF